MSKKLKKNYYYFFQNPFNGLKMHLMSAKFKKFLHPLNKVKYKIASAVPSVCLHASLFILLKLLGYKTNLKLVLAYFGVLGNLSG